MTAPVLNRDHWMLVLNRLDATIATAKRRGVRLLALKLRTPEHDALCRARRLPKRTAIVYEGIPLQVVSG